MTDKLSIPNHRFVGRGATGSVPDELITISTKDDLSRVSFVIEIEGRFFYRIGKKGQIMTAWSLTGAHFFNPTSFTELSKIFSLISKKKRPFSIQKVVLEETDISEKSLSHRLIENFIIYRKDDGFEFIFHSIARGWTDIICNLLDTNHSGEFIVHHEVISLYDDRCYPHIFKNYSIKKDGTEFVAHCATREWAEEIRNLLDANHSGDFLVFEQGVE